MTVSIATFPNGRDIDECVAHDVHVAVVRSGEARWDVTLATASGETTLRLWTSRVGTIALWLDGADDAGAEVERADDGGLVRLRVRCRAVHLENLTRGAYALSLESIDGADVLLQFSTRGYLRCATIDAADGDA